MWYANNVPHPKFTVSHLYRRSAASVNASTLGSDVRDRFNGGKKASGKRVPEERQGEAMGVLDICSSALRVVAPMLAGATAGTKVIRWAKSS